MGPAFKLKSVARAVNWTRLIFRYDDEKKKASLSALQSKWAEIRTLHSNLPRDIKPIDWNYWRTVIKTNGVVDEFKKKYDQEVSKEIQTVDNESKAREAQYGIELKEAEESVTFAKQHIKELEDEIDLTIWESKNLDKLDADYYFKKFPGYQEECEWKVDHAQWFPDPNDEKVLTLDHKELRRQLNEGDLRVYSALAFLKPEVQKRGPFKGWPAPTSEELLKNYQQSPIWVAHQIELQDKQN